jgi:hypothetical protein
MGNTENININITVINLELKDMPVSENNIAKHIANNAE